jgi:hypothetical protein
MEVDSDSDAGDTEDVNNAENTAVFTRERVREYFDSDEFAAYCESNQRLKRKKRKLLCRRDVVDVDDDADTSVEVDTE